MTVSTVPPAHLLEPDALIASARGYGVPHLTAAAAADLVSTGRVRLVGISGKMGSGKDTVAPLVMDLWKVQNTAQVSFASALKDQLDEFFTTIRVWGARHPFTAEVTGACADALAAELALAHGLPEAQAREFFTGPVATEVLSTPALTSRSRTAATRYALQKLGTDVRRAQDDLYWVKRSALPVQQLLGAGQSVYSTDCRFTNELDAIRALGGVLIRVDVSPEVQAERLMARDGLVPDAGSLTHRSETEADTYPNFHVRVSNDGPLDDTIDQIRTQLADLGLL